MLNRSITMNGDKLTSGTNTRKTKKDKKKPKSKAQVKYSSSRSTKPKDRVSNKGLDGMLSNSRASGSHGSQSSKDDKLDGLAMQQHRDTARERVKHTLSCAPWIEKHRPKQIKDTILDPTVKRMVENIIKDRDMPNLILTGIPGTGKTTTVMAIARALYGKNMGDRILEMNASDDRGIKSVQETIIKFCKKVVARDGDPSIESRYSSHKIVFLDEVDNMTKKAQQLVNILMDEYKDNVRFAFTCNNSSDIIEAIQSRCHILRFRRLEPNVVVERLRYICETERVKFTEGGLRAIVDTSQGDIRRCVNSLQLTYNGYGKISIDNVYKLCDVPYPITIKQLFLSCKDKDVRSALKHLNVLRDGGYTPSDISLSMVSTLKSDIMGDDLDEETKIKFMMEVSKTCLVITKGVNSPLQLTGCIAKLCL